MPPEYVYDLFRLRIALCRAGNDNGADLVERWRHAHKVLLEHPVLNASGLAINGKDLKALGMKPGPQFGAILDALLQRVIENPMLNERQRLLELAREAIAS